VVDPDPDRSVYSGRRVLHTRWVITWILGAAVVVEAAKTMGIMLRNLRKIEWLCVTRERELRKVVKGY